MVTYPLISVIIPTYNRDKYISYAVESVLNQTYPNIELYIIDDGSTDNTESVVKHYLNDPKVKYYKQVNAGQAAATNRAIKLARGEYLGFLDADDMWIPDKLELQMKAIQLYEDVSILYSPSFIIDENNNVIGRTPHPVYDGIITNYLFIQNFIPFGTVLVRKECFDKLGLFDETLVTGLDYDLWLRFSTHYKFGYISEPTLLYRVWAGQVTSNTLRVYENGIRIMERFLQRFPGAVDKKTENEAWAFTYVGYGQCLARGDGGAVPALKLYLRALQYKPHFLPAWKVIVKFILGIR